MSETRREKELGDALTAAEAALVEEREALRIMSRALAHEAARYLEEREKVAAYEGALACIAEAIGTYDSKRAIARVTLENWHTPPAPEPIKPEPCEDFKRDSYAKFKKALDAPTTTRGG